jgi:hypothetical protein
MVAGSSPAVRSNYSKFSEFIRNTHKSKGTIWDAIYMQ